MANYPKTSKTSNINSEEIERLKKQYEELKRENATLQESKHSYIVHAKYQVHRGGYNKSKEAAAMLGLELAENRKKMKEIEERMKTLQPPRKPHAVHISEVNKYNSKKKSYVEEYLSKLPKEEAKELRDRMKREMDKQDE
jgi:hypothetical protein